MGYFGSKATSGLCQPLIAMIPPHDTYIETHLGGGAIMKRKPAALRNIGIDRDARALDAFECDYPVELVHGCAHRYLAEFEFQGSELVYSDPPYLKRTRTSRRRYRFDYEEADHVALLELLKGMPCQVMVSGYPSTLYEERLRGCVPPPSSPCTSPQASAPKSTGVPEPSALHLTRRADLLELELPKPDLSLYDLTGGPRDDTP